MLLIEHFTTNFCEILIEINTFSFEEMHLKMYGKWRSFCLGLTLSMPWNKIQFTSYNLETLIAQVGFDIIVTLIFSGYIVETFPWRNNMVVYLISDYEHPTVVFMYTI